MALVHRAAADWGGGRWRKLSVGAAILLKRREILRTQRTITEDSWHPAGLPRWRGSPSVQPSARYQPSIPQTPGAVTAQGLLWAVTVRAAGLVGGWFTLATYGMTAPQAKRVPGHQRPWVCSARADRRNNAQYSG
jgi:hypothetical protein